MTLPASGLISLEAVRTELGVAAGSPFALNQLQTKALARKTVSLAGAINLQDLYGKTGTKFSVTVAGGAAGVGCCNDPLISGSPRGSKTPTQYRGGDVTTFTRPGGAFQFRMRLYMPGYTGTMLQNWFHSVGFQITGTDTDIQPANMLYTADATFSNPNAIAYYGEWGWATAPGASWVDGQTQTIWLFG